MMDKKAFEAHVKTEHYTSPFSDYLKEIVYGGNDGIVTTFAVVAGFSGASLGASAMQLSYVTVILFGLANLFADGAAMGLGNFLAIRSEQHLYRAARKKEADEVEHSTHYEKEETIYLLKTKGFDESQSKQLTEIFMTNKEYWIDFMMHYELEMDNPERENPLYNGIATFISFVIFGAIPLLPYFFMTGIDQMFIWSCTFTLFALILLGLLRGFVTKEKLIQSILEVVAIGGVSALVAFFVGHLFTL